MHEEKTKWSSHGQKHLSPQTGPSDRRESNVPLLVTHAVQILLAVPPHFDENIAAQLLAFGA